MYWNRLNDNLKAAYGCKVYKLALSSGCTCPNRDGTLETGAASSATEPAPSRRPGVFGHSWRRPDGESRPRRERA